jgi:acyl carrier protein
VNNLAMAGRDDIFQDVCRELHALFDIEPQDITLDARLYEDLDLDSIDAVDLIVRLQEITRKRIQPDRFKGVRTVKDVVDAVEELVGGVA